ncbi:MAG: GPW/gp25 family protein [Bacteroidales bacterium]|nr:GPW/gp25 family protein [Bacteroidales bacterium]MCD8393972.1 GPW/gp25 family protein [Bacteroidales bacterium]
MSDYINIPLDIDLERLPSLQREAATLERRIDTVLDLIVFTPKGSFNADPEFGFEYWNHEFTNVNVSEFNNSYLGLMSGATSANDITRQQCEDSLRESILAYEPRLERPEVQIELDVSNRRRRGNKQSKYEMRILISGFIDEGLGISRPYQRRISFMVEPIAHKYSI